ncbi:hypothetical protein OG806_19760 [Streptomyces sp. NBC_00882]|uniref:DUF4760 domain-containing protein n=1 Tax=Streptomyces TaxID=1883 RepID=UPI00386EDF28|nr:hypothetical protein OG806_19760 [Streptomyces sp. NBC_00882]WSZ58477.1 hypothetical protein OH824_18810 [Streptomyces canus]
MDRSLLLNLLALFISICAVAISVIFGMRQLAIARHANYIPALLDLLSEFRKVEFHEQYNFVCVRLREEYSPELGLSGLPLEVKEIVYSVLYFFQTIAKLYALEVLSEEVAMGMVRGRVVTMWRAIEPYVIKERGSPLVDDDLLSVLGSFAADAERFTGP